jgi:hypothetical protein
MSLTIFRFVHAPNMTQVIHSQTATQSLLHVRIKIFSQFNILHAPFSLAKEPVYDDPCNPSPCGSNSKCLNGVCSCLPEYHGDPYTGCRPECVTNNECSRDKSCTRNKCVDPCPGTCGQNAVCDTFNHIPMCSCPQGMAGNAFIQCIPQQCMYFFPLRFLQVFKILNSFRFSTY